MKKLVTLMCCTVATVFLLVPVDSRSQLATDWEMRNHLSIADMDSLYQSFWRTNSRTVIGGFDLDEDGKKEIILTDYGAHNVRLFEYNSDSDVFEQVWMAPPDTAAGKNHYSTNPRTVGISDFDGDNKREIVFPLGTTPPGWYVFEWDGVQGSDNYGTTYSSIFSAEVDTCCASNITRFRGRHERVSAVDIDGDNKQELIVMIRDAIGGGKRGTLIASVEGDIEHNAGGTGFESWNVEFFLDRISYGGGSPYHSLPADLDGDGTYELVNHTWNNFNFYIIDVLGADSYQAADLTSEKRNYKATPSDDVSLAGGDAIDIDGDGDDEAFFVDFGDNSAGPNEAASLWIIDYKSGDDVLAIDSSHVLKIAENVGTIHVSIFDVDKNGRPNIFTGGGFPHMVFSTELTGSDHRDPASYTSTVIYEGEADVLRNIVVSDSNGTVDSTFSNTGGFVNKVQSHWNNNPIDFDNDGDYEVIVGMQGNHQTTTRIFRKWNGSDWDSTETELQNPKPWVMVRLEFTGMGTGVEAHNVRFITPDDYTLQQNYPNPFNPATTIEYALPIKKEVSVKIYNMLGQVVRILVDKELQDAGNHAVTWDARDESGIRVASGTYMYTLEFGNFKKSRRMTLVK